MGGKNSPPDAEAAGAIVDAMIPLLGITIDPAWRAEIITQVRTNAAIASLVLEYPLEDELEPAPVFRA